MQPILTSEMFIPVIFAVAAVGIGFLIIYGIYLILKVRILKIFKKRTSK